MRASESVESESRFADNPFSAGRFSAGRLRYRFPTGHSAEKLVRRWEEAGREGEIVGPHGSGKSTLLADIIPVLERRGRDVSLIELHDGATTIPLSYPELKTVSPSHDLLVDGYEQLSWWGRVRLRRFVRNRRCGILVTAHRSIGFPPVYCTGVDLELAGNLVSDLASYQWCRQHARQIELAVWRHNGNLREVFFDLYDLYEKERSAAPCRGQDGAAILLRRDCAGRDRGPK